MPSQRLVPVGGGVFRLALVVGTVEAVAAGFAAGAGALAAACSGWGSDLNGFLKEQADRAAVKKRMAATLVANGRRREGDDKDMAGTLR